MTLPSILLIERSDELRRNLLEILQFEGYEATSAETAADALTLLGTLEVPPRLVICEIVHEGMTAAQFVEAARPATGADTAFLFVSTQAALDLPEHDMADRIFYLLKPFYVADLLGIVQTALNA